MVFHRCEALEIPVWRWLPRQTMRGNKFIAAVAQKLHKKAACDTCRKGRGSLLKLLVCHVLFWKSCHFLPSVWASVKWEHNNYVISKEVVPTCPSQSITATWLLHVVWVPNKLKRLLFMNFLYRAPTGLFHEVYISWLSHRPQACKVYCIRYTHIHSLFPSRGAVFAAVNIS